MEFEVAYLWGHSHPRWEPPLERTAEAKPKAEANIHFRWTKRTTPFHWTKQQPPPLLFGAGEAFSVALAASAAADNATPPSSSALTADGRRCLPPSPPSTPSSACEHV